MAEIVLVHGINHHLETADGVESAWIPALAGGVRLAGRPDLADRLRLPIGSPGRIECRTAYYGDLFRAPDQQGAGDDLRDLTAEQQALAESLALEWLARLAERAPADSREAAQAGQLLEMIRDPEAAQAQGGRNVLREITRMLARAPWLAHSVMYLAERSVKRALNQVTRYLTDDAIRSRAREAVMAQIGDDTKVLIGHSLGSVVAYECAHRLTRPLPLLVTLGSPLGLRTIVTARLDPPPSFPPMVEKWLNHANLEDYVAAEPDLRPLFGENTPFASRLKCQHYQERGSDPHRVETYLGRAAVGEAVIEAVDNGS